MDLMVAGPEAKAEGVKLKEGPVEKVIYAYKAHEHERLLVYLLTQNANVL